MSIGERIKAARERQKITQTELAEAIGTTKQNIYKYENGIVTNIPLDKIEAISIFLGISPAYLMGWESSTTETDLSYNIADFKPEFQLSNPQTGETVQINIKSWSELCDVLKKLPDDKLNEVIAYAEFLAEKEKNDNL